MNRRDAGGQDERLLQHGPLYDTTRGAVDTDYREDRESTCGDWCATQHRASEAEPARERLVGGELTLERADGGTEILPSKVPYHEARHGDRVLARGPNGGGYGDPLKRDPAAVLDDVLDGHLDVAQAAALYGVAIRDGAVDDAATAALRQQRAA